MSLDLKLCIGFTSKFNYKIPPPVILKPVPLWTGKQVFSTILPDKLNHLSFSGFHPDFEEMKDSDICSLLIKQFKEFAKVTVEPEQDISLILSSLDAKVLKKYIKDCNAKFKRCVKVESLKKCKSISDFQKQYYHFEPDMSPSDTRVIIRDGNLECGYLCKKSLGNTHNSLIHIIALDYDSETIRNFINDVQKVAHSFARYKTCSVGMKDMRPHPKTKQKVDKILEKASESMAEMKKKGNISAREYEVRSNKILNDARKKASEDTFSSLPEDNAFKQMVASIMCYF
jgi:DNA-directed RNA polymerase II subunit RPB1